MLFKFLASGKLFRYISSIRVTLWVGITHSPVASTRLITSVANAWKRFAPVHIALGLVNEMNSPANGKALLSAVITEFWRSFYRGAYYVYLSFLYVGSIQNRYFLLFFHNYWQSWILIHHSRYGSSSMWYSYGDFREKKTVIRLYILAIYEWQNSHFDAWRK